ncbi:hypothetical protein TNCT_225541 [Trichonephila clavata]|uniref:Uncharacterized protein n=1 Tax=Trichonephila clavata TaxID=2740835 RepID=A0A8X6GD55_TRICU|nr:hypothetical protein TNCT_225541 [Trichonephila clavata]
MDSQSNTDFSRYDMTSPTLFYPPSLDELYSKLKAASYSMEILSICSLLDCKINDLSKYVFTDDDECTNMVLTSTES